MSRVRRSVAVIGSGAVLAALGLGGVMTAQADTSVPPSGNPTAEAESEGAEVEDGPDVGRDANPNEPGHQDADDANDEASENEADSDVNTGPDSDPNEPGHQDANDDEAAE